MKYIVIGLGNFGSALAKQLTQMGNEVIGVDLNEHILEEFRSEITDIVCLDSTDEQALKLLPLKDTDMVIVAIGQDIGLSIITTAILKKLGVQKILARALSSVHETVLKSLDVTKVIIPEQESALQCAVDIEFVNFSGHYLLAKDYTIFETDIPKTFIDQTLEIADFQNNFQLQVIAIKKTRLSKIISKKTSEMIYNPSPSVIMEATDKLVLMGDLHGFRKFNLIFE